MFTVFDVDFVYTEYNGYDFAHLYQISVPIGNVLVLDTRRHIERYDGALTLDVASMLQSVELFLTGRVPDVEPDCTSVRVEYQWMRTSALDEGSLSGTIIAHQDAFECWNITLGHYCVCWWFTLLLGTEMLGIYCYSCRLSNGSVLPVQALVVQVENLEVIVGNNLLMFLVVYGKRQRNEIKPIWTGTSAIYLLNHAWTFRTGNARRLLTTNLALVNRLTIMLGIDQKDVPGWIIVSIILNDVRKWRNPFTKRADFSMENRMPMWYVVDDLGDGILHSNTTNCKMISFIHITEQMLYNLLFSVKVL